jgi:hypothetical protein
MFHSHSPRSQLRENRGVSQQPQTDQVKIRRAPKFGAFLAVGAVAGFIATLILTSLFPTDPSVGLPATVAYFSLYGVSAGVVLGAVVALILDRVSSKRAKSISVEHEEVIAEPEPHEIVADSRPEVEEVAASEDAAASDNLSAP